MTDLDVGKLPPPKDVPKPEFGKPDHTKSREGLRRVHPAKKAPRAAREPRIETPPPKGKAGQFVEPLEQVYTGLALTLMPFDSSCAETIMENGHRCAEAWDDLAQKNDTVRKALIAFTETSAWGTLVLAHAPILLAVASHHGPGRKRAEPTEDTEDIKLTGEWSPNGVPTR